MKTDFISCKKWLRRNFPHKYPLRILVVKHETIIRCDKDGGFDGPSYQYEDGFDGYCITYDSEKTKYRHRVYVADSLSPKRMVEVLLHEYAHVLQFEKYKHDCGVHDETFQEFHKKILRKWAAKCT